MMRANVAEVDQSLAVGDRNAKRVLRTRAFWAGLARLGKLGIAGDGLEVLIGQFTTNGTVTLTCNIQYRASDGTNPQATNLTIVFPNNCPEDINGDGSVTVADVLQLLGQFGLECE